MVTSHMQADTPLCFPMPQFCTFQSRNERSIYHFTRTSTVLAQDKTKVECDPQCERCIHQKRRGDANMLCWHTLRATLLHVQRWGMSCVCGEKSAQRSCETGKRRRHQTTDDNQGIGTGSPFSSRTTTTSTSTCSPVSMKTTLVMSTGSVRILRFSKKLRPSTTGK